MTSPWCTCTNIYSTVAPLTPTMTNKSGYPTDRYCKSTGSIAVNPKTVVFRSLKSALFSLLYYTGSYSVRGASARALLIALQLSLRVTSYISLTSETRTARYSRFRFINVHQRSSCAPCSACASNTIIYQTVHRHWQCPSPLPRGLHLMTASQIQNSLRMI